MSGELAGQSSPAGVEWEMVVRYPWDDKVALDVRAVDLETIEVTVTTKNAGGGATGSRRLLLADVRRALDELERSAREVERLG